MVLYIRVRRSVYTLLREPKNLVSLDQILYIAVAVELMTLAKYVHL